MFIATLGKGVHVFRKKFRFYFLSKMRAIFIREIDVFLKFFSKFYQQNFFTGENTQFFKIFVDFVFWFYPFEIAFSTSKNQSKFRWAAPGDFRNFKIWIFYLKWHRFAQGGTPLYKLIHRMLILFHDLSIYQLKRKTMN